MMSCKGTSTLQAGQRSFKPLDIEASMGMAVCTSSDKCLASIKRSGGESGSNDWTIMRKTKGISLPKETNQAGIKQDCTVSTRRTRENPQDGH
jgi:hypothetical protein